MPFIWLYSINQGKTKVSFVTSMDKPYEMSERYSSSRPKVRYLSEIADTVRNYNEWGEKQGKLAHEYQSLSETLEMVGDKNDEKIFSVLESMVQDAQQKLEPTTLKIIEGWEKKKKAIKTSIIFSGFATRKSR